MQPKLFNRGKSPTISRFQKAVSILLLATINFCFQAGAQTQTFDKAKSFWVFGDGATIKFNPPTSGNPNPTPTTSILEDVKYRSFPYKHIATMEGTTSIADPVSNMPLFFTDGSYVWDKEFKLMNNGTGNTSTFHDFNIINCNTSTTPGGSCSSGYEQTFSSTQAAIIIPVPGSAIKYFIFSVDDNFDCNYDPSKGLLCNQNNSTPGLRPRAVSTLASYSIVDMSLNAGLGGLTSVNIPLPSGFDAYGNPTGNISYVTEKITAIKAIDGNYWLILHQAGSATNKTDNTFLVYKITSNGPICLSKYNVGSALDFTDSVGFNSGTSPQWGSNVQGYMKVSPDSKTIAMVSRGSNIVEFFGFDNRTGALSSLANSKAINSNSYPLSPYGLSFDQSGQYVYVAESNIHANAPNGSLAPSDIYKDHIWQYKISSSGITLNGVQSAPVYTCSTCTTAPDFMELGGLQLGPDGKIYYTEIALGYSNDQHYGYSCLLNITSKSNGLVPDVLANCGPSGQTPGITVGISDRLGSITTVVSTGNFTLEANAITFTNANGDPAYVVNVGVPNIVDANGGSLYCANASDPTIYVQNNSLTGSSPNLNSISGQVTWTGKHFVSQNVYVHAGAELDMIGIEVAFAPNTGIIVEDGGKLIAINSTFQNCDLNIWNGFDFQGASTGKIEECQFINAVNGIKLEGTAAVRITNNLFRNNSIGINAINTGTQFVDYTEGITGNTFLKDLNTVLYPNNTCNSTVPQYYGIFAAYRNFTQQISQNNFVFTGDETTLPFYGIHMEECGAVIGQNNFTDLYRAIDIHFNKNNTSIENNNFQTTYNTGSNTVVDGNRFQVALVNDNTSNFIGGVILVSGNVFKNNIPQNSSGRVYAAIYSTGVNAATISQNQITGFDYSIYCNQDGEASGSSVAFLVSENEIKDGNKVGIMTSYCDHLTIADNIIDMHASMSEGGSNRIGILYRQNNFNSNYPMNAIASIKGNCIFNTNTAIDLQNWGGIVQGPSISNNFLYNYNTTGIYNEGTIFPPSGGFNLTIGNCSYPNAGGNTFSCNNYAPVGAIGPPYDIYNGNSMNAIVSEAGNWYGTSNGTSGPYLVGTTPNNPPCNISVPSKSACGSQVHRKIPLPDAEAFKNMIQDDYPVTWDGTNYQLNPDAAAKLSEMTPVIRENVVKALLQIYAFNNDLSMYEALYKSVQCMNYDGNGSKWVQFTYEALKGACGDAIHTLNTITPADKNETDLITIEKYVMTRRMNNEKESDMSAIDKYNMQKIIDQNGVHANLARTQLINAFHNMDLKFDMDTVTYHAPINQGGNQSANIHKECLEVYPNPSHGTVNVSVNVSGAENNIVTVSDMNGKTLREMSLGNISGEVNIQLNDLKQGTYIIDLHSGNKIVKSAKLIIK
jgi:hypothetical protein